MPHTADTRKHPKQAFRPCQLNMNF